MCFSSTASLLRRVRQTRSVEGLPAAAAVGVGVGVTVVLRMPMVVTRAICSGNCLASTRIQR